MPKQHVSKWAGLEKRFCLDLVNVGTSQRRDGCPCALAPDHEGNHRCACGTEWTRSGGLAHAVGTPRYPAICGWRGQ